jgi:hypothetical protein
VVIESGNSDSDVEGTRNENKNSARSDERGPALPRAPRGRVEGEPPPSRVSPAPSEGNERVYDKQM